MSPGGVVVRGTCLQSSVLWDLIHLRVDLFTRCAVGLCVHPTPVGTQRHQLGKLKVSLGVVLATLRFLCTVWLK